IRDLYVTGVRRVLFRSAPPESPSSVYGSRFYRQVEWRELPRGAGELFDEPTEGFPEGLPPDRGVRASAHEHRLVEFLDPSVKRKIGRASCRERAWNGGL